MNQKEIFLTIFVLIGLAFTAASFTEEDCYDCNQPLFSQLSSCSGIDGPCIKIHNQAGFSGLWSHFTTLELRKDADGFILSCSPDCFIRLKTEPVLEEADSVYRIPSGALQ